MTFAFVAKHCRIWPVSWLCDALDAARSGSHAWLGRAPSTRSREDDEISAKVRARFIASARTYGGGADADGPSRQHGDLQRSSRLAA